MSKGLDKLIYKVANLTKLEEVLTAVGITLQMNLLTSRVMVGVDGEELEIVSDSHRAALVALIKERVKLGPASDISRDLTLLSIKHAFHPVCDYLDSLAWDGKPRIDSWLRDYLQAMDCEYVSAIGRLFLLAAVRRVRQPGCKFDECVVLIGTEGIGKSESIKALVPDRRMFSDSLPLGQDPKQTVEKTEGIWICESAELVGNSPAKIHEIKAFLSRQEDGPYRAAYGMESTVRLRQFVPIATNNDPLFLSSVDGNRRFWPVKVWHCDHEKLALDRDQLWAEASMREKAGEPIRLQKELWEEARKQQEDSRNIDPWEEQLLNLPSEININDLYSFLNKTVDRRTPQDGHRLAGIMTAKGYKRERRWIKGEKVTVYRRLTPFDHENFDYTGELKEEIDEEMSAEDEMAMDKFLESMVSPPGMEIEEEE